MPMPTLRRILVFQHIPVEHPGIFRDFLNEDGIRWDTVELDAGAPIPRLDRYDGLWVMGGPMDVWEEDTYPWLCGEKAAIREAVADRGLPYLGVCLGHQLLADALGGDVGPAPEPEIGVLDIEATKVGQGSEFLEGLPPLMKCLQWHSAEVKQPPSGANVLVSTSRCRVQAMAVGDQALGVQFHVELTPTTVTEWGEIPTYRNALEKQLGPDALAAFDATARAHMPDFNHCARRLYDNWVRIAFD